MYFFKIYFYFMYLGVLPECMCAPRVCSAHRDLKRALELEFQMVMNLYVGAKKWKPGLSSARAARDIAPAAVGAVNKESLITSTSCVRKL